MKTKLILCLILAIAGLAALADPTIGPPFTPYVPPATVPEGGDLGWLFMGVAFGLMITAEYLRRRRHQR